MKERFVAHEKAPVKKMEAPKHGEMFLDGSLYELLVEEARYEGKKRERKGVMTAIGRFLKTSSGKTVQSALLSVGMYANIQIANEQLDAFLKRGPRDIYEVEDALPSPDSFAGDRPLAGVREELSDWIGESVVRELIPVVTSDRDRIAREHRREDIRHQEVAAIGGFEAVGISHDSVQRYLEEGYPRFMTARGNVKSIEFTTDHLPMREDYHLGRGVEAAGTCSIGATTEASEIRLFGSLLDQNGRVDVDSVFRSVLTHELAHSIDWENLDGVDPATRVRMLHQMVSHVRDEKNRLHFSYVEEISSKDPQEQLKNRTVEYYAEFTANVFAHAPAGPAEDPFWSMDVAESLIEWFGKKNDAQRGETPPDVHAVIEDVELVRAVVRAYDPEFDWEAAAMARTNLIDEMRGERTRHELQRVANEIESDEARAFVKEAIGDTAEEGASDASFIRHIRKGLPVDEEISSIMMQSSDIFQIERDLEGSIISAQSEATHRLERDVSQIDMPAYLALSILLEALPDFDPRTASPTEIDVIDIMIKNYRAAALHATPAHVEAARHHFEITQGTCDLPASLRKRINDFLNDIDFERESAIHG